MPNQLIVFWIWILTRNSHDLSDGTGVFQTFIATCKCPRSPIKHCFKTPWLLLAAVGCQPTAPKYTFNFAPTPMFQGCMVAFQCNRLPAYSPKMPQVPSNSSISSPPWLLLSAVGCKPTAPKCHKFPPNPRVSRPWLLLSAVGCQPTAPKLPTYSPRMPQVPYNPGVSSLHGCF